MSETRLLIAVDQKLIEELMDEFKAMKKGYMRLSESLDRYKKEAEQNALLTTEDAAKYLGVTVPMIDYYEKHGLTCYRTCHRGKWFRRGDIDDWIADGRVNRR